mmetsp:Transcript_11221/g.34494  ORF Transcript_11221/g.34494 Transcript_11221/m.34494 type:complete len:385 (+) Transcript_11221:325-1479(+)
MKRARDAAARDDARDDARAAASWLPRLRRIIDASASPLSFLSFVDRARVEAVSRQARDETRDPSYWREFCQLPSSQKLSRETQSKNADALNGLCGCASGDVAFFSSFLRKTPSLAALVTLDLKFSAWGKITDASLHIVAARCPALARLDVGSSYITDDSIKAFARPALTSLDIGCCKKMTDTALLAIARNCPGLVSLRAMFCEQITDSSMVAIAENCPSLACLNLGGCRLLTSSTFGAVGTHLPALQDLCASYLTSAMTDVALECIAAGCPCLTRLNVGNSQSITDSSLECIAAGCPRLARLDISDCPLITDRSLDAIMANCSICELALYDTRVTHKKYRPYWCSHTLYRLDKNCEERQRETKERQDLQFERDMATMRAMGFDY